MSVGAVHGCVKPSQHATRGGRPETRGHDGQADSALCRRTRVHNSGVKHSARELGGCRSTSVTRCQWEVEDGTDGWAQLSATMEERERKLGPRNGLS
jgi:hypothetical protein